jgi:hypothetical protein
MGWFKDLGREKPWAQGCVIFASGVALALSGCFGFLLSLDYSGGSSRALKEFVGLCCGAGFVLGAIALPVGFVWWIVGLVKSNARRTATDTPAPPPPPPGEAPSGV